MVGSLLRGGVRRLLVPLDARALLSSAMRQTGLEEFGEPPCEEALRVLVDSCNSEADLSLFGHMAAQLHLLDLLCTRLRLVHLWRQVPEIQKQVVREPLFITGMPRSGTTFLHALFARDPGSRVPLTWEVMFPFPPPTREEFESDPRIGKTENRLRLLRWSHPSVVKAHPIGAALPQECIAITSYSLQSDEFLEMFRVPSYEKWLRMQDMPQVYEFHRSFLKHLQWRCPGDRWVLKSPDHVHSLEALLSAYPDARIVFMHRDPMKVLGSVASLTSTLRGVFSRRADLLWLGVDEARVLADKADKLIEFHRNHRQLADRFIDVRYTDLVRDPMGTVKKIYDTFGFAFSSETEAGIGEFIAETQNRKRRRHVYHLSDYGVDERRADAAFDLYRKQFALERESF